MALTYKSQKYQSQGISQYSFREEMMKTTSQTATTLSKDTFQRQYGNVSGWQFYFPQENKFLNRNAFISNNYIRFWYGYN
jgi:hypothetical protein